jgi:hypothetical protein
MSLVALVLEKGLSINGGVKKVCAKKPDKKLPDPVTGAKTGPGKSRTIA